MLSVKNLSKIYKSKGGVEVRALDDISVEFPDKGMVFLLGKSGSGKSTLLNVAGGLDYPDKGEIIVKGRSSQNFSASDFDSYRNTYIGFIFQEYNILNEFSVEQNIALALQLQNKKNDKEAVDKLLEQVDLSGLGKRKPLTLSGGQKQRVAIARALIKDPEIIMADEPTGALDSNTGKQVFDTLKKLSEDRLIIVVSHDREFAEIYGDRIIELKDGKVLTDESKNFSKATAVSENIFSIDERTVSIKSGASVSKAEFEKVWQMVNSGEGEIIISSDFKKVENFKKSNRIAADGAQEYFKQTTDKDIKAIPHDGKNTKFIKSRLPMSHAVKIGASSMKAKPVRLILTMFISILAFGLFGIVSTMMMYDANFTTAKALEGTDYNAAVLQKRYNAEFTYTNYNYNNGTEDFYEGDPYSYSLSTKISKSDLDTLNAQSPLNQFAGVYAVESYSGSSISIAFAEPKGASGYYSYNSISGFSDAGNSYIQNAFGSDAFIAGTYPTAENEIAISEYLYEILKHNGIKTYDVVNQQFTSATVTINTENDVVGKFIEIGSGKVSLVKITGVIRSARINPKFDSLKDATQGSSQGGEQSEEAQLLAEFTEVVKGSFANIIFVTDDFYDYYMQGRQEVIYNSGMDSDLRGYVNQDFNFSNYQLTSEFYNSFSFMLPEWANKYSASMKLYSFADGSDMPFSSIASLGNNETFMPISQLLMRAEMLANANKEIDMDDWTNMTTYRTTNSDFDAAYNQLSYYVYGNWNGPSEQEPETRTITQAQIATIINALNTDWNEWVKNNSSMSNMSQSAFGDADKAYYKNGSSILIKGVYDAGNNSNYYDVPWIVTLQFLKSSANNFYYYSNLMTTNYVEDPDAKYMYAISPMLTQMDNLSAILALNVAGADDSFFEMTYNDVYTSASFAAYMISQLTIVFLIMGIVLAALSALLLFNYISVSISDKTRDIGILRAVGARGADVFKIFFSESLIISIICIVLAIAGAVAGCILLNYFMASSIVALQILDFGLINALLIAGAALFVAFAATILPVTIAAKRVPVESIRAL